MSEQSVRQAGSALSGSTDRSTRDDVEALSRAVLAITERTEAREVLQMIVESARTLVRADYAALGVPDEQGRFAEFYAAGVTDEEWRAIGPVPRAHGLLGAMMREGGTRRLDDLQEDPRFSGWPSAHPDMHGFLGVPVVDCGETLGAVYVANRADGGPFSADDERLLTTLAAHAAIALSRSRMVERMRELTLVEERARIARDLHDAVAQKLFSLRLTARAAGTLVGRAEPERVAEELGRVTELAGSALDELRAVVTELRPPAVAEDGLVPALRKHIDVIRRAYSRADDGRPIEISFEPDCDGRCALPAEVEDMVFRVAQEALHNALRHARPRSVRIVLLTDSGVTLSVTDDGTGMVAADPASAGGVHLGMASMKERARRIGGRLRVVTGPGSGTTVTLEVPHG